MKDLLPVKKYDHTLGLSSEIYCIVYWCLLNFKLICFFISAQSLTSSAVMWTLRATAAAIIQSCMERSAWLSEGDSPLTSFYISSLAVGSSNWRQQGSHSRSKLVRFLFVRRACLSVRKKGLKEGCVPLNVPVPVNLSLKVPYPEKNQTLRFPLVYASPQWTQSGVHLPLMILLETPCLYLSAPHPTPPSGSTPWLWTRRGRRPV